MLPIFLCIRVVHTKPAIVVSFLFWMVCREKMYECLVDGCPKKFKGDFQREKHLIDAHRE